MSFQIILSSFIFLNLLFINFKQESNLFILISNCLVQIIYFFKESCFNLCCQVSQMKYSTLSFFNQQSSAIGSFLIIILISLRKVLLQINQSFL